MVKLSAEQHLIFRHCFSVPGQKEAVRTVRYHQRHRAVVEFLIAGMCRSDDLRTGVSELYHLADIRSINGTALIGAGIKELLKIDRSRRLIFLKRRHYYPSYVKTADYACHSAHVVGVRMSSNKAVDLFHAAGSEVVGDSIEVLVLTAVDEHYLSVTGKQGAVALSDIYKVYRKGVVCRKIRLWSCIVLPYEEPAYEQDQQYKLKIQCFVLFCFPLFPVCRSFPEFLR